MTGSIVHFGRAALTTIRTVGEVLRAAVALAILLALVVGVPYGLVRYIGWPLPDHVPTWDAIQTALLAPMTPQFLLDVFACVLWPTWARFMLDILDAILDAARSRSLPRPTRGLRSGPLRAVAAALVGAIVFSILSSRTASHQTNVGAVGLATGRHTPVASTLYHPAVVETTERTRTATAEQHMYPDAQTGTSNTETVRPPAGGVYDSLWRIAQRCLGDGNRWPEIWNLNKGVTQVDGRVFTNPSLIRPGWTLRLPTQSVRLPAPPVQNQAAPSEQGQADTGPRQQSAPTTSTPDRDRPAPTSPPIASDVPQPPSTTHPGTGISLSTGAFVGIGFAALVTLAVVTVRLRRRRRYRPNRPEPDDPSMAPMVRALRIAHDAASLPEEEDGAPIRLSPGTLSEVETRDRARRTAFAVLPNTGDTVLGTRDGQAVALDLARSRGLGFIGTGAHAAVRALVIALLAAESQGSLLVIPASDAHALFGVDLPHRPPERLRIVDDLGVALDTVEAELLARACETTDETDLDREQGSVHSPLALVATPTADAERRLQAILDNGSGLNLAGLLLGQWRAGGTVRVRDDGTVGATSPTLTEDLAGARLFTLPDADTAALLDLLRAADPAPENPAEGRNGERERAQTAEVDFATPPDGKPDEETATVQIGYEFVVADANTPGPATPRAPEAPPVGVVLDFGGSVEATVSGTAPQDGASEPSAVDISLSARSVPFETRTPRQAIPTTAKVIPPTSAAEETERTGAPKSPDNRQETPALRLQVLGRLRLIYAAQEPTDVIDALAPRQREILVYLALHRGGSRREALTAALWPGAPGDRPYNSFHATLSQLRRALRRATTDTIANITINDDGHYSLDKHVVAVDLWHLQDALTERRRASTADARVAAMRRVVELYSGGLAEEIAAEWIDAPREALRRDVLEGLSDLVRVVGENDPEQTLALLEQARTLDPYNEAIYRDLMRTQARLGRTDSVPRTLTLLTRTLAQLDERPTRDTFALADFLGRPRTRSVHDRNAG
ncbi:BTAD domain-containing putative transcriptional regulator [Amycolatopsis pigmentata]|uniref:BTAD domain-containing putative transcriptional regulator n=1 Tax=Amycolatopsis pigmentata TaxID=450801 RepID=A0ABW5FKQ9_9PSEU